MTARQQGQGVASPGIARCSRCGHGTPTKGRESWRPFGRHAGWINACCQREAQRLRFLGDPVRGVGLATAQSAPEEESP